MRAHIHHLDGRLVRLFKRIEVPLARAAISIVYAWFGFLKLIGASPAQDMVTALFDKTLAFMIPFATFYALFALFEILIGFLFLIRGWERVAIALLALHLVMTSGPLLLLPAITWQGFLMPTLAGQYIIKNILILSLAVGVGSKLITLAERAECARVT